MREKYNLSKSFEIIYLSKSFITITFIIINTSCYQIEIIDFDFIESFDLGIRLIFPGWNYIYIFIRLIYNVIDK